MKNRLKTTVTRNEIVSVECDKCGKVIPIESVEFGEMMMWSGRGGYGSVFGDGSLIEIDLCQECFKETLGEWIRVTDQFAEDTHG